MKPPTTRALTPARIVALVLIGLTIAGLAYLRFAPDDRVSVPKGAQAGDLVLEPCTYATEDGSYDADCGTLVVSENPADPQSRLIALPVTRIRALSQHPKEPVFRLEGGPGITNMQFSKASRYAADRDVVLVGYRGVDGSVRLDCPEVDSAMKHSTDFLGEKSFRAYEAGFRACAARLTDEGFDLTRYGLAQQVDDLEAARKALGYDRIDLLSESAGTRTALIYAWRHPKRIHRSVMIGVNPPGHFLWDRKTTDEQLGRYAALCAKDEGCRTRTDDLAASMRRTAANMPDRWLFLPIEASARSGLHVLRAHGDDVGDGADERADRDRLVALRGRGRRERALAPVARREARSDAVRLGPVRVGREARRPGGGGLLRRRQAEGRLGPRLRRNGVRLGRRPAGRRLAGRAGRERVQPHADVEGGDPPDRRCARLLDPAAERAQGAPAVPAERPPGRASGIRALGLVLERPGGGRHAPRQHVPLERPGRRLALRAPDRSTSRRT